MELSNHLNLHTDIRLALLQGQVEVLRQQLGIKGSSVPVKSVTLYVLEGLAMELQRMQADQAERQKRLDTLLKELRKQCILLGEDEGATAAEVHPSLGASRCTPYAEICKMAACPFVLWMPVVNDGMIGRG